MKQNFKLNTVFKPVIQYPSEIPTLNNNMKLKISKRREKTPGPTITLRNPNAVQVRQAHKKYEMTNQISPMNVAR